MPIVTSKATRVVRIPVHIEAHPAGVSVAVHASDGWAAAPTAALRLAGEAEARHVALNLVTPPHAYAAHVGGLGGGAEGTVEVTGATAASAAGSAVEDFVFLQTHHAVRMIGPGGHVVLDLPAGRGERALCIGPPGLDLLACPRGLVVVGRAYAITTTEERFTKGTRLSFRLPRGALAPGSEAAVCRWNGGWATWDRLPGEVHASDWQMVTAELSEPGVYAVVGAAAATTR